MKTHLQVLRSHAYKCVFAISLIACALYALVWRDFLMSSRLFGDYGLSIPALLDYYFWAHENGFATQWFTPGFCGGIPVFPEPQSSQYSVLTLFTYFAGPTAGVKVTFLFHAWLGFWGAYLLCRRAFRVDIAISVLAATLFMFNGFYAYRIVVSHLFFGLMYTPLLAWLLIESCAARTQRDALIAAATAGLMLAAYVYGGGLGMAIPFCAGVLLLVTLWLGIQSETLNLKALVLRALFFVFVSCALCAPKIIAAGFFLGNFPRDSYKLPGFASLLQLMGALWSMFFSSPKDTTATLFAGLVNSQWLLERHEWEFGVTIVPLILTLVSLRSPAAIQTALPPMRRRWFAWMLCGVLVLAPVALNYYTPEWNQLIKQIPVFKSSSNLIRYFWIWIVFLCFFPAMFFSRFTNPDSRWRMPLLALCLVIVPLTFATQGKEYYARGSTFDPTLVESKYREIAGGNASPVITSLGVIRDAQGNIMGPLDRNQTLATGMSQLWCYQPIFGYRLEAFPFGDIHPGEPQELVAPNRLNFKNPACMVYPEANGCALGDEFHADQAASLDQFLHYSSYSFALAARQYWANAFALLTLVALLVWVLGYLFWLARRKLASANQ